MEAGDCGGRPENASGMLRGVYFSFAGAIHPRDKRMADHVYNGLFGHHCRKWKSENPNAARRHAFPRLKSVRRETAAALRILLLRLEQAGDYLPSASSSSSSSPARSLLVEGDGSNLAAAEKQT